jgi:hypothetical protein
MCSEYQRWLRKPAALTSEIAHHDNLIDPALTWRERAKTPRSPH